MNPNTAVSGFEQQVLVVDDHAALLERVGSRRGGKSVTGFHDLTTSLIAGVKKLIWRHGLKPGERLPTERQLAAEFGVNRASVRQALKALVAMGVLIQRVGDGTYVSLKPRDIAASPAKIPKFTEGLTVAELFDFRGIVEPVLISRAATKRTEADLIALESAIAVMNEGIDRGAMNLVVKGYLMFYECLWEAAGDRVLSQVLISIQHVISQSMAASLPLSRYRRMARSHSCVLDAIRSRNHNAASSAIETLLKIDRKELAARNVTSQMSISLSAWISGSA